MAQPIKDWNVGSSSTQPYFSGKVHKPLPPSQAIQNAQKIVARYKAATPSTDSQAIIWSDASRGGGDESTAGGFCIVCDICLPNKPKYAITEARYINPENSSVIAEAKGIWKGLRRLKKEIEAADFPPETQFAVILVTDCKPNVTSMSKKKTLGPTTARQYIAVLRGIKSLSEYFLGLGPKVTLELHWCPRNQTPQLRKADFLAGHSRKMRKWFYERKSDTRIDVRIRDGQKPSMRSQGVNGLDVTMETSMSRCPTKAEHTTQTRRRKIPMGNAVEESVGDSLESASRQNKRRRLHNEEPQAASSHNKPQDTVPVPANTEDQPTDDAQNHLGGRRWYQCMVM